MKLVKDGIYYVGVQDEKLRIFDIVMHTEYGTSYNAYIVEGSEKVALFETCKEPFFDEQLKLIEEIMPVENIDYLIMQHTEPDHSGSVEKLLTKCPNLTVVGTTGAITFLKDIVNHDFNNIVVKRGDKLDLGGKTLEFLPFPMLHWPDTMYTYIAEDKTLFTCDSFGCHYSSPKVFDDEMELGNDYWDAYKYYFVNILGPYKHPFLDIALKTIETLDFDCICNCHGPVLRKDVSKQISLYKEWCKVEEKTTKTVAICYCSAYGYTESLAKVIAETLTEHNIDVKMFNLVYDKVENVANVCKTADGILLGSCTILGDSLPPINNLINCFNPTIHKGKKAGAFGCFAWSGEAVPNMEARMKLMKFDVVDGYKVHLKPNDQELQGAKDWATKFAEIL